MKLNYSWEIFPSLKYAKIEWEIERVKLKTWYKSFMHDENKLIYKSHLIIQFFFFHQTQIEGKSYKNEWEKKIEVAFKIERFNLHIWNSV